MKQFSAFCLAEVDVGIYSDEMRVNLCPIEDATGYPLSLICNHTAQAKGTPAVAVEFGDVNWGTHYGIIQSIDATTDTLKICFAGDKGPVPWLETKVSYDWSRITHGKEMMFHALRWLCARDGIPYSEAAI